LANSVVVLVVSGRAGTTIDLSLIYCVEWTGSTDALEDKLAAAASKHTNSTGILGISRGAYTLTVQYDLIGCAGEAVSICVKDLIALALADALVVGDYLTCRAVAGADSIEDHSLRAD
jgi:hypothetical protein